MSSQNSRPEIQSGHSEGERHEPDFRSHPNTAPAKRSQRRISRLLVAGAFLVAPISLLGVGAASASTVPTGSDVYPANRASCLPIETNPNQYTTNWEQSLLNDYEAPTPMGIELDYPMPIDLSYIPGMAKVEWQASLYVYDYTTQQWLKFQTESAHTVFGPWTLVNSSTAGYLNWDGLSYTNDNEASAALPAGFTYAVGAQTWFIAGNGSTLAYNNQWLTSPVTRLTPSPLVGRP